MTSTGRDRRGKMFDCIVKTYGLEYKIRRLVGDWLYLCFYGWVSGSQIDRFSVMRTHISAIGNIWYGKVEHLRDGHSGFSGYNRPAIGSVLRTQPGLICPGQIDSRCYL
jgi:hypothetical protein